MNRMTLSRIERGERPLDSRSEIVALANALRIEVLRARVQAVLVDGRQCRQAEVGAALPALIRDLHTSIAAGRDVAELLDLAVLLHTQSSHGR